MPVRESYRLTETVSLVGGTIVHEDDVAGVSVDLTKVYKASCWYAQEIKDFTSIAVSAVHPSHCC